MTLYWEDLTEFERGAYRDNIKKQLWQIYSKTYPVMAWWGGGSQWERINVLGPSGRFPPYNQTQGADSIQQSWQLLAEFVDRPLDDHSKRTAIVLAHSVTDDPTEPFWLERLPPTKKKTLPFQQNPTCRCNPDDELRQLERDYAQEPSKENLDILNTARVRAGLSLVLAGIADAWRPWVTSYPPKIVSEKPEAPLYECENYVEAVRAEDNIEEFNELPCEVVWFDHIFYVVFK